jgi:hypothetical protein
MERTVMERGIYAQGWYHRGRCYHPSLPPRSLKMTEDFADYRGTMITWPSLGGGAISLSYLEHEAWDPLPPRMRQYGFLNDSEFLTETRARGVKAFSVIFSTQGWEFPAEFSEDESEVLAMNELRGAGKRGWLGLREFTQNRYPKIWDPFEKYFPDGLLNSRGERVTDLFEECVSRDIHGGPIHADWLEVPDREHVCHFMNIGNPVWREYLKAIVRIHVDAGVDGIQFDEPDSPFSALSYGGDFSYDVLHPFAEHLRSLPEDEVPEEVRGDLHDFDYGAWLLARGSERVDFRKPGAEGALARLYVRFLQARQKDNFHDLASYVREYAASKGREVLVSSNLYDGGVWHEPLAAEVDILVPEQRFTLFEQPAWMRYIAAFAGDKPVCISFNPYDGVLPGLVPQMNRGRSFDRYRVMLYEAAALGVNMSVPYGAWMGSKIHDAMWAPYEETVEIQDFIADHESLFGRRTVNDVGVVFSVESNFWEMVEETYLADKTPGDVGEAGSRATPFQQAAHAIGVSGTPFDVVMFHDGRLREDDVTAESLRRYRRLVLPDAHALTPKQVDAVLGYLDQGGSVTISGRVGSTVQGIDVAAIGAHPRTLRAERNEAATLLPGDAQVSIDAPRVGANLQSADGGVVALHIVNYDYDEAGGRTAVAKDVAIDAAPARGVTEVTVHAPGRPTITVAARDGRFVLAELGCYAIVSWQSGARRP